jgi:hypothetical protein
MLRAERLRLQSERAASVHRSHAQRLHRTLRDQADTITPHQYPHIAKCPDLRALIAAARAQGRGRFQFRGCRFSVRPGCLASSVYGPSGRIVGFWTL